MVSLLGGLWFVQRLEAGQPLHALCMPDSLSAEPREPKPDLNQTRLSFSGVRNHAGHLRVVGVRNQDTLAQVPLGLDFLRREDMPHLSLAALNFARASLFETLRSAPMSLKFGHGVPYFNSTGPPVTENPVDTAGFSLQEG
jgi:hypothetical protein